jgi:hypothetical protein
MSKHYKAKKKFFFIKMDKQNHKISTIKSASACHAIQLAPHKQDAKPLIFKKKQKDIKVIPLKVKTIDTGRIRHFTPAAQE